MVESLRKLVSGNRRRFTDEEFSLDLTYITPNRLIAMSYPASGFESLYRNKIDKVSGFLPARSASEISASLG
jgi:phosphatidylinositol-3,4,5-trisphosphate 3-phosphatase/dual-specificity protein phosphatase PTEN